MKMEWNVLLCRNMQESEEKCENFERIKPMDKDGQREILCQGFTLEIPQGRMSNRI